MWLVMIRSQNGHDTSYNDVILMYLDLKDTYFENEHPILETYTLVSCHLENEHPKNAENDSYLSFSPPIWVPLGTSVCRL